MLDFQRKFYEGDTHNDVLLTKSQLASTYSFMGQHEEAESIKSEVLDLRLKIKGKGHHVTLRCMSSLGMTLVELGRPSEAELLIFESFALQKELLGH